MELTKTIIDEIVNRSQKACESSMRISLQAITGKLDELEHRIISKKNAVIIGGTCETCKYWLMEDRDDGLCSESGKIRSMMKPQTLTAIQSFIRTFKDFGCNQWEGRK